MATFAEQQAQELAKKVDADIRANIALVEESRTSAAGAIQTAQELASFSPASRPIAPTTETSPFPASSFGGGTASPSTAVQPVTEGGSGLSNPLILAGLAGVAIIAVVFFIRR